MRDPSAKPALTAALADPATREDAVWALGTMGKMGERVRLAPYLDDADWRVRVEASRAVGLLEEREAISALERMRGSDPMIAAREWAARGLSLLTGKPEPYRTAGGEWKAPDTLYH
jgi:HEAT repeat protein